MSKIQEYYELQENPKNREQYFQFLKTLSNKTTSREFFTLDNGSFDPKRKKLHNDIIDGYLKKYPAQSVPRLHFVLGSIGSGKTSLKDTIFKQMDSNNLLYINFDDLKLKLSEYQELKTLNPKKAAQFVQSESAKLAGGLYSKSTQKKVNIIYEKNLRIGQDNKLHITEEIKRAFKKKYIVSLHIVFLDSYQEAWRRVQLRYEKIRRYVPKKEVSDTFNNLFPNLNKLLTVNFKSSDPIKVWIWYNGLSQLQEPSTLQKANLIGLLCFSGKQEIWDEWYKKYPVDDRYFVKKQLGSFGVFFNNRVKFLPTSAKKNLLKIDCFKKAEVLS